MNRVSQALGTAVAASILALGMAAVAHAQSTPDESPCAAQAAKVEKAQGALARVTAVFERQKDKVTKAQAKLDEAETPAEVEKAEKKLEKAQAKKADASKAKKAQFQRLAKAQERLEECEAAQTP